MANASVLLGVLSLAAMIATIAGLSELDAALAAETGVEVDININSLAMMSAHVVSWTGVALAVVFGAGALIAAMISYRGVPPGPVKQGVMWVLAVVPAAVSVIVFMAAF